MVRCTVSILLYSLLAITSGASAANGCDSSPENWQSSYGILISPLIQRSKSYEIQIYWNNLNVQSGDKISLYEEGPTGSPRITYTVTPNGPNGVQNTGIRAEFIPSSNLQFAPKCTKYGVAISTDRGIKEMRCLQTQPTWMGERKQILGDLRMSQVFLPGTHDSAAYDRNGPKANIVSKFAVTQDVDILGQLIHGARYLDIRAGHYPLTKEVWWTNHGLFYRSVTLKTVIDQVKKFLDNTEEIVLLDVREFPVGFNNISDHQKLVAFLENEFRGYYLTSDHGWGIKLNDIWSSGKRLIIGYENNEIVQTYKSMWPCVTHQWGNVRKLDDLYNYLSRVESSDSNSRERPRSAMAELTPNANDIIWNRLGSLREMAHRVNLNVTNWYSTIWQYSANIVAVDFVRDTDIVEIAIKSNENRHKYCR